MRFIRAGCCGEDWYWFDFGAVRFVIYPEPYTADTWTDWAARAEPLLAAAERDAALSFVVTAGHRPAYSSGHHGGEAQLRAILDGFGKKFSKYVLNLSGHRPTSCTSRRGSAAARSSTPPRAAGGPTAARPRSPLTAPSTTASSG